MNVSIRLTFLLALGMGALIAAGSPAAQSQPSGGSDSAAPDREAQVRTPISQRELDRMLAPIALYPDALLAQILMAATYPLEVVQAARWSREHSTLKGEEAVQAAGDRNWDPSVKALLAFPQVLFQMDAKIEWTESLGNAFLAQQAQVMDTAQTLRRRAVDAGNLKSGDRVRIVDDGHTIVIEPADPAVVYVPVYDPWWVFGPWWWPGYGPMYSGPAHAGGTVTIVWGPPLWFPYWYFHGAFDWHHRHAHRVHHVSREPAPAYREHRGSTAVALPLPPAPPLIVPWQHDLGHRRGVARGGYPLPIVTLRNAAVKPALVGLPMPAAQRLPAAPTRMARESASPAKAPAALRAPRWTSSHDSGWPAHPGFGRQTGHGR